MKGNTSIQAYFPPTPNPSPTKSTASAPSDPSTGDGFTAEEVREALKPRPAEPWHPAVEYADCEIRDLYPGPRAVSFMGRISNVFDVTNTPKTPRSAKGCVKLCVKDDTGAVTVRLWYANRFPNLILGSLVSIWATHVSNGENGTLSSVSAPLFVSLFPERDRSCHLMIHENSDDGTLCKRPLDYRSGQQLNGLMTLQNFIDGGCDVLDAKILVVVKSIGAKKRITRKDESTTENVNLCVHDDTAGATLGLWGTAASSPFGHSATNEHAVGSDTTYLNLTSATLIDVDPSIPDADWLRRWSMRQKSREAINPPFPENTFDLEALQSGPLRCLYTIGELDEFVRAAPTEIFQGYLSLLLTDIKLYENYKRRTLFSGDCCNIPTYANAVTTKCRGCDAEMHLRLNPRVVGQVMDESAAIGAGKLLFSDRAWRELLGREPEDLLEMGPDEIQYLSDRLLFCRVTMLFGWVGDDGQTGGRICVLGVQA